MDTLSKLVSTASLGLGDSVATQPARPAASSQSGNSPAAQGEECRSRGDPRQTYSIPKHHLFASHPTRTGDTVRASWTQPPPPPPHSQVDALRIIPIASSHSLGAVYNGFRRDPVRGRQWPHHCRAIHDVPNRISRVIGRSWDLDPSVMSTKVRWGAEVPGLSAYDLSLVANSRHLPRHRRRDQGSASFNRIRCSKIL